MASSDSNMSAKDVLASTHGAKINPNEDSAKETQTVKTVDISQSAGQSQDIKRPVEIVHEIPVKEHPETKKD